jgi:hypothetical protein
VRLTEDALESTGLTLGCATLVVSCWFLELTFNLPLIRWRGEDL